MSFKKIVGRIIAAILGLGFLGFVAIQFVPVARTNPPVVSEPHWDSSQTEALVAKACNDCHSNETVWPWYSHIAPVSWFVANDVEEGRKALNFSEWQPGAENEAAESVQEGKMPMPIYLVTHPEARLTEQEIAQLITGLQATFGDGEAHEGRRSSAINDEAAENSEAHPETEENDD